MRYSGALASARKQSELGCKRRNYKEFNWIAAKPIEVFLCLIIDLKGSLKLDNMCFIKSLIST